MAAATRNGRVGVIGTVGTIESGAYQTAVAAEAPWVDLCALSCPGFVEFVERGEFRSHQVHVLAERLLHHGRRCAGSAGASCTGAGGPATAPRRSVPGGSVSSVVKWCEGRNEVRA